MAASQRFLDVCLSPPLGSLGSMCKLADARHAFRRECHAGQSAAQLQQGLQQLWRGKASKGEPVAGHPRRTAAQQLQRMHSLTDPAGRGSRVLLWLGPGRCKCPLQARACRADRAALLRGHAAHTVCACSWSGVSCNLEAGTVSGTNPAVGVCLSLTACHATCHDASPIPRLKSPCCSEAPTLNITLADLGLNGWRHLCNLCFSAWSLPALFGCTAPSLCCFQAPSAVPGTPCRTCSSWSSAVTTYQVLFGMTTCVVICISCEQLSSAFRRGWHAGELPDSWATSWPKLQSLSLAGTNVSGTLPAAWGSDLAFPRCEACCGAVACWSMSAAS